MTNDYSIDVPGDRDDAPPVGHPMRLRLSAVASEKRNLGPLPSGQPTAAGGEELRPSGGRTAELRDSWGLLLVPIAICVVLAGYASLFMR